MNSAGRRCNNGKTFPQVAAVYEQGWIGLHEIQSTLCSVSRKIFIYSLNYSSHFIALCVIERSDCASYKIKKSESEMPQASIYKCEMFLAQCQVHVVLGGLLVAATIV